MFLLYIIYKFRFWLTMVVCSIYILYFQIWYEQRSCTKHWWMQIWWIYNLIFLNGLYTKINENCGVVMFLVDGDFSSRKNNEENLWVYLIKISGESFIKFNCLMKILLIFNDINFIHDVSIIFSISQKS